MSQDAPNPTPTPSDDDHEQTRNGMVADYDMLPTSVRLGICLLIVAILAIVLGFWHDFYWHWFEVHSGTVNESGPYYGFWSGFGSDIGEATLVVGIVAAWHHHNCHVKGCPRLGRPVPGTPYVACPRHHPEHKGRNRGVSLETIYKEHEEARQRRHET